MFGLLRHFPSEKDTVGPETSELRLKIADASYLLQRGTLRKRVSPLMVERKGSDKQEQTQIISRKK